MKRTILLLLAAMSVLLPHRAKADFNGSTYTLTGPFSLYITSTNVTIANVVAGATNAATLIVSNSATAPITVNWTAPAHAIGLGTTNRLVVPGGEIAQIVVNAVFPNLLVYSTQLEYQMPEIVINTNATDIVPELLYYRLTEGFGPTTPPVYLADSSTHGGTTGTVNANVPVEWVSDQTGSPQAALHFNGNSTSLDTMNNTLFNFTTNLFTINLWVRPLVYNPILAGNGTWAETGWFFGLNSAGAAVMVANSPGFGTYVGTGPSVVTLGQWCMLTAVRTDTTTILIYKNAVLLATTGSFANPAPCTDSLVFGDYHGGGIHYDGDMGVVRIYNRPLSTNEINTLYTNSAGL